MAKTAANTRKAKAKKKVETLSHEEASRKNIPTAEHEAVMHDTEKRQNSRKGYQSSGR